MARRTIRKKELKKGEQYTTVDDMKLRLSLAALSDHYSEKTRAFIYACYNDAQLASIYRGIRRAKDFETGGKSKVYRKIAEFPNGYVYDFCDTVLSELYGKDWWKTNKAFKHELVRPWWVVDHL